MSRRHRRLKEKEFRYYQAQPPTYIVLKKELGLNIWVEIGLNSTRDRVLFSVYNISNSEPQLWTPVDKAFFKGFGLYKLPIYNGIKGEPFCVEADLVIQYRKEGIRLKLERSFEMLFDNRTTSHALLIEVRSEQSSYDKKIDLTTFEIGALQLYGALNRTYLNKDKRCTT